MERAMIIINFKAYPEATGTKAVHLAQTLAKEAKKYQIPVIICPQTADIAAVHLPVFAQHLDPVNSGAATGWITAESLRAAGASGVLINHSEHPLSFAQIKQTIKRAQSQKLITVVCVRNLAELKKIVRLNPSYLALEPPELIGSKISVSPSRQTLIKDAAKIVGNKLLVGAGIHTTEDVRVALRLGAQGVLVASGVVKAKNPQRALRTLIA